MLWFNDLIGGYYRRFISFQYILCCGSTMPKYARVSMYAQFQYILCCGSTIQLAAYSLSYSLISIHLMLWFNLKKIPKPSLIITFQYILCCGSTKAYPLCTAFVSDFNTSYVVVQRLYNLRRLYGIIISIHLMLWFNQAQTLWNTLYM